jgi:hypothetical protein
MARVRASSSRARSSHAHNKYKRSLGLDITTPFFGIIYHCDDREAIAATRRYIEFVRGGQRVSHQGDI